MAESVFREESGMRFGPFDASKFYDIEGSRDVRVSNGFDLKSVEFVCVHRGKLLFVEAKKTAPKVLDCQQQLAELASMIPNSQKGKYKQLIHSLNIAPKYVADICQKFIYSLCLVLSLAEGRLHSDDIPAAMLEDIKRTSSEPVFLLVVADTKPDWIANVQNAFNIALRPLQGTNNATFIAMSAEKARKMGLISDIKLHNDIV